MLRSGTVWKNLWKKTPWKSIHGTLVRGSWGNWIRKSWDLWNIWRYQEIPELGNFHVSSTFFQVFPVLRILLESLHHTIVTLGREYQTPCWILNTIWAPTIVISGVMTPISRVFSRQLPSYKAIYITSMGHLAWPVEQISLSIVTQFLCFLQDLLFGRLHTSTNRSHNWDLHLGCLHLSNFL